MSQDFVPAVLSVRVSPKERMLIEMAAEQSRTSLSDFVRRKAVEAAEADIVEHRMIVIPEAKWKKFEAWVDSPAKDVPALRSLAATQPVWKE